MISVALLPRLLLLIGLLTTTNCVERANYRFTTCGSRDREGPTYMECTEHYCNFGSLVCGHLLNEGTRGSQIFVVPRSGNYTVTIAGASGGHGVCSNYSGLGVIVRETVQFRRGEILRILVGQQGTSACDGHQDVDVCQLSDDTEACETLWSTTYANLSSGEFYIFDGGGGGGGASLLEFIIARQIPIVIAPGGGGAGALYNITTFLSLLNITHKNSNLEELYKNNTYGHAYESFSEKVNGTTGAQVLVQSAGAGAGYKPATYFQILSGPDELDSYGYGGQDCGVNVRTSKPLLFPDTHGGFGGGGGGCNGGGGGGGYTGGSIIADGAELAGEGGYSWPNPPWPLIGYNDGDGYVELFLESCGCTYNCIIYNQSSFECSCPSNALLAPNGFDCYREENYHTESKENQVFQDAVYGEITADIIYFNNTMFVYSIAVVFSNESISQYCAVLLVNNIGKLTATTKFINRLNGFLYLELFSVTTVIDQNGNISVNLSMNSEVILEEPLSVASVITFGIEGDCIMEELTVNASVDDIYDPNPEHVFNTFDERILSIYLNSFKTAANTSDNSALSTAAVVGIIIAAIVLIISVVIIVAVGTYFCCHHKKSSSQRSSYLSFRDDYALYNEKHENSVEKSPKRVSISNDYTHSNNSIKVYDDAPHEYEMLIHGYENIQNSMEPRDTEISTKQQTDVLKYGLQSPLHNYYHFNRSRQNSDWSFDRAQLIYMREIAEGQFGKVLLMTAKDICGVQGSVLVAVKTLTSRDPKDIQRFSEEMNLMKKFIHPNIVSFLGHCEATSDSAPMMILELMQYGDLKWFLQSNRLNEMEDSVITSRVALSIVTDIASALQYLSANHFVHRDVAARNCLIGERFTAKLSDFGLARGVHEKDYYIVTGQTLLPVRWMAPESLLYGKFTSASDVWSFGVLVWEIATYAETPHGELHSNDIIEMAGNGTLKLNSPVECPEILASLISQCTRIQPKDRPTFNKILEVCSS